MYHFFVMYFFDNLQELQLNSSMECSKMNKNVKIIFTETESKEKNFQDLKRLIRKYFA